MNNLSVVLSNLGQREDALAASTQAVEIYRRLAATDPAAFEPDLARALTNLGADLSDLGRLPDALAATIQAVDIRRGLAAANPAAFEPDLNRRPPASRITAFWDGKPDSSPQQHADQLSAPAEPAGRREPNQRPEHDHNDDHNQDCPPDTRAETPSGSRATIGYWFAIKGRRA
ncbi:MAG: tetratricopeptide repeat protein [Actinobacteria bacterium]|nr:tetratricopeptide repeat protein [Actinomycetota bacterium]